jgi:hypothetical protein
MSLSENRFPLFRDMRQCASTSAVAGQRRARLLDLFFGVNRGRNVVKLVDDFEARFSKLAADNKALHAEMTATERYKKAQAKILAS